MLKILIIEDSDTVAAMYQRQLVLDGFEVDVAKDGKEGLSKAEAAKHDVILLDIVIPEISGLDLLQLLKKNKAIASVPVVAISAFGSEENRRKALEFGAVEFIEKEKILPKDLSSLLRKVL